MSAEEAAGVDLPKWLVVGERFTSGYEILPDEDDY